MSKFLATLKHEIVEAIPPAIFFFIAFQVIAFTQELSQGETGVALSTFISSTIAALIVAKVILIVDLMPFVNRYPDKPLIYNIAWKTAIYIVAALIVRILEELIPLIGKAGGVAAAFEQLLDEVVWHHFWSVQIWLLTLFAFYCTLREVGRVVGRKRVMQMFFSHPATEVLGKE